MLDCKNPTKRRKATGGNIYTHSGSLWEKKISRGNEQQKRSQ